MAGLEGLEPSHAGIKTQCLTAWLQTFKMGWLTGLEPATSGVTIQNSIQLSYNHH